MGPIDFSGLLYFGIFLGFLLAAGGAGIALLLVWLL